MADHDNFLSSSSDDGLPAGLTVNTTPETRACNMRMLANVGESLNRIKTVRFAVTLQTNCSPPEIFRTLKRFSQNLSS